MSETNAKNKSGKQTEIGEIPESWKVVELGDYSELITKGSSPKWQGFDYCDKGILFVRSQNVGLGRLDLSEVAYLPKEFNQKEKKSILQKNDLLINIVGASIGRVALANDIVEGGNINQAVAIARLKRGVEPFFIMAFLLALDGQFQLHKRKKDIARANLSLQDIKNLLIPLPPLPEQRAIAHVLQTIQEAKSARQREFALERECKAALMDYLFSHGTKDEPRKQTEIGEIPESWEVVRLGEATEIIMGQSPKGDTYNTDGEGEPLINGPAEFGSEYPTPVQWTSKPTKLCKDGDILFCVRGNTTGRMNIADQSYCIGRGIAAIRGSIQKSDTLFIRNLLECEIPSLYRIAIGGGSTFPNISTVHLKNYTIALPSISEQAAIAEILQACDTKITALEQEAERLDELFHAMLDELMTGQRSAVPLIDSELPN